ncbi:uncharacterized protein LOC111320879 [Stylophora pistillata]|uniref:VWFA domain-containing protein n=1 Tax=Stylophora pistillata TaxID=50429 RepID=A0A2B4STL5_STYPI|nr:uncharacterized protein LOC111320879 [Stylophora pistillata]PFX32403.1 hypothetical protein AWC38_SpisGene2744 [Stylophora pistillata]
MNAIALLLVTFLVVLCRGKRSPLGECPYVRPPVDCGGGPGGLEGLGGLFSFGEDKDECSADDECSPPMKCCMMGCNNKCVHPVTQWCQSPVDLAILFDAQKSTWPVVRRKVLKIVHKMSIRNNGTHIALRAISKKNQLLLGFDQLKGRNISHVNVWKSMKAFIPEKGNGNLITALKNAKDMFDGKKGARENAIKLLLVASNADVDFEESDALDEAAQELKDANVLVQTVGITNEMSLMTMVQIATSDIYVWPEVDNEMLNELRKLEKQPCSSDAH